MTLAVEFMLKRTKLLGKPYMECSEDPESNHCYQSWYSLYLYQPYHMLHITWAISYDTYNMVHMLDII